MEKAKLKRIILTCIAALAVLFCVLAPTFTFIKYDMGFVTMSKSGYGFMTSKEIIEDTVNYGGMNILGLLATIAQIVISIVLVIMFLCKAFKSNAASINKFAIVGSALATGFSFMFMMSSFLACSAFERITGVTTSTSAFIPFILVTVCLVAAIVVTKVIKVDAPAAEEKTEA